MFVIQIWTIIEILAAAFSLACVYLAAKNNIWNWPISILATTLYFVVFYHNHFFSEAFLQMVFCGLQIYGWFQWLKPATIETQSNIQKIPRKSKTIITIVAIIGYLLWLSVYPKLFPTARYPYIDAALTVGSLTAIFMQSKRWIENWYLWIGLDIAYVPMFLLGQQPVTAFLYLIFIGLAYYGLTEWKKKGPVNRAFQ